MTKGAGLLCLLFAAGCATSSPQRPSPAAGGTVRPPLEEAEIGIVTSLIDMADRRDFDFSLFAEATGAENSELRRQAAYAAGRIGGEGAGSIARHLLADPDSTVSAAAAFALGELADTSSVTALANHVQVGTSSAATNVALEAAEALGKIGTDEASASLRRFLSEADTASGSSYPAVVATALLAGWRAGITETAPFARWVAAPSARIRSSAVYALTRLRHPDAIPLLRARLTDADWLVRSWVLRGLRGPLVDEAVLSTSEVASEIRGLLADTTYAVRIEAIRALATYGPGPSRDAVIAAALTGSPHERAAAIEAIGSLGPSGSDVAATLLGIALDSQAHAYHRQLAIEALARIDPGSAAANLPVLLAETSWRLRAAAGGALASLPALDYPLIVRAATDPDPRVATATVLALSERADSASLRSVRGILVDALRSSDVQLRAAALNAGARIADPTLLSLFLDAYAQAQTDSISDARLAAIDAIAGLKERGVPFPERVFFARFPESPDYLVRRRVEERFGREVRNAWGPAFPLESQTTRAEIEAIVRQWIAPAEAELRRPHILMQTNRGDVVLELFPEDAPLTVANFLSLARSGFFDGQEWPRVVPNFVVQGGDPRGDTAGSPGYVIRDEMNSHRYEAGTLGMALSGPDTGGSQFFITLSPQPHLDGTYTVFGRLLSGMKVIEQLMVGDQILRIVEIPRHMAQ